MSGAWETIIADIPSTHGPWEKVLVRPFPDFQNPSFNLRPLLQHSLAQTWLARIGFKAKYNIIFPKKHHVAMSRRTRAGHYSNNPGI